MGATPTPPYDAQSFEESDKVFANTARERPRKESTGKTQWDSSAKWMSPAFMEREGAKAAGAAATKHSEVQRQVPEAEWSPLTEAACGRADTTVEKPVPEVHQRIKELEANIHAAEKAFEEMAKRLRPVLTDHDGYKGGDEDMTRVKSTSELGLQIEELAERMRCLTIKVMTTHKFLAL